jgi:O-methyltransferase
MSDASEGHTALAHEFLLKGMPTARAALALAPEPRAVGATVDAEGLRAAYLDLLKLALCDLTGTATMSVGAIPGVGVVSSELRDEQRGLRWAGIDWPLHGVTMVGLPRLADLQSCIETVAQESVPGDLIEAGAWRGGASILMRAVLDSLGCTDRTVVVADSFQGFPDLDAGESDGVDYSYEFFSVPLDEVKKNFARFGYEQGVEFVPGFFEDTLSQLTDRTWALVRLDGDSYSATQVGLRSLYPSLAPGGYIVIDDYSVVEGCRRAVNEFRREYGITEPIEEVDWMCVRWRRQSTEPLKIPPVPPGAGASERTRISSSGEARALDIPTRRELELTRELSDLRARLAELEANRNGSPQVNIRKRLQRVAAALRRGTRSA